MKRKFLLLLLVLMLLLSSCTDRARFFSQDTITIAEYNTTKLTEAITNQDFSALNAMFSVYGKAQEGFDDHVYALFEFIQGDIISCDYDDSVHSGMVKEKQKIREYIDYTFRIETSTHKYDLAVYEYFRDDLDQKNVGILSLYIIDATNRFTSNKYQGGLEPGIHIIGTLGRGTVYVNPVK